MLFACTATLGDVTVFFMEILIMLPYCRDWLVGEAAARWADPCLRPPGAGCCWRRDCAWERADCPLECRFLGRVCVLRKWSSRP